jgi:hypothetical protein
VAGLLQFAGTGRGDLNYPVLLSFGVLALVATVLLLGPFRRRAFQSLLGGLAAAGILIAMWPILKPDSLRPIQQFQARAWIGLLPVGLALLMVLSRRRAPKPAAFRMALGFLIVLGLTQLTWQMVATAQWYGYTRVFQEELGRHAGLVPFESSELARDRVGIQALRTLTWNYTNPLMSIALAVRVVASIIEVPQGMWQRSTSDPGLCEAGPVRSTTLATSSPGCPVTMHGLTMTLAFTHWESLGRDARQLDPLIANPDREVMVVDDGSTVPLQAAGQLTLTCISRVEVLTSGGPRHQRAIAIGWPSSWERPKRPWW